MPYGKTVGDHAEEEPATDPTRMLAEADAEQQSALKGSLAKEIPKPEQPLSGERVRRLAGALDRAKQVLGEGEIPATEFEPMDEDYRQLPDELWVELVALRGAIDEMKEAGLDVASYDDFDPTAAATSDAGLRAAEMTLREMADDSDLADRVGKVPDEEEPVEEEEAAAGAAEPDPLEGLV